MRRLWRWAGGLALAAALLLGLGLAFFQSSRGRAWLRTSALSWLQAAGLDARLESIEATPAGLLDAVDIRIEGLELARRGRPPFLSLRKACATVSPSILRGDMRLKRVEVDGARLTLVRDAAGGWNLPRRGDARSVDIRAWLGASYDIDDVGIDVRDDAQDLEAHAQARLSWNGSALRGSIELSPGVAWRWDKQSGTLEGGTATLETDGSALRATGMRLAAPTGQVTIGEAVVPLAARGLTLDATWQASNLDAILRALGASGTTVALAGRADGTLAVNWDGADWRDASVDAEARIDASPARAAGPRWTGVTTLQLRSRDYALGLDHRLAGVGTVTGRLQGTLNTERVGASSLAGPLRLALDPGAALSLFQSPAARTRVEGRMQGDLHLDGTITSPHAAGDARLLGVSVGGAPALEGEARLDITPSRLAAERIEVRTSRGDVARGRLVVGRDGGLDGRFEGRLAPLECWASTLPDGWALSGEVGFVASLAGTLGAPAAEIALEGSRVGLLGQPLLRRADARITASPLGVAISSLVLEQDQGGFAGSGRFALDTGALALSGTARDFRLEPMPAGLLGERRLPFAARVSGTLDLVVDGSRTRVGGRMDLADVVVADRPLGVASLELQPQAGALGGSARLPALDAEIDARLTLATPALLTGEVRLREADVARLTRASGIDGDPIDGKVTLRASITGEAARLSETAALSVAVEALTFDLPGPDDARRPIRVEATLGAEGSLGIDRLRGRARIEGLHVPFQGTDLHPIEPITALLRDRLVTIPSVGWRGGANDFQLGGTLLLPAQGASLSDSLVSARAAGSFDLRALSALTRGLEGGGVAALEAHVSGTLREPRIEGSLRLDAAILRHRPYRLFLDDVSGTVRAASGVLHVDGVTASVNGGTAEAKGQLALAGLEPRGGAIALSVSGASLDWPRGLRGAADAALELRGTPDGPLLAGTVSLLNGFYAGDPVPLLPAATTPTAPVQAARPSRSLGLDLRLRTEQAVRVDNPFGVFSFTSDLRVAGSIAHPRLQGQVVLAPGGYLLWSGRRFTLERAVMDWNAAGGLTPFVQARASSRVSSYVVTADVSGPLTRAVTNLSSDPPLSRSEVTALVVTGNTRASQADSRALGIVSASFLGNLGRHAGLDSVRIESGDETSLLSFDPTRVASETNPGQRLTVTKRLTHNLEATMSLNLSESGKTTTFVGYKPLPALELRVAQRDDYSGALEVRHDVVFGGGTRAVEMRVPEEPADRRTIHETVRSVEVEYDGEVRAPPLRVSLELRPGRRFDYEKWQTDRERLEEEAARQGFAEAYVVARRDPRSAADTGAAAVALRYVVRRGPPTAIELEGWDEDSLRQALLRAWSQGDYDVRSSTRPRRRRARTSPHEATPRRRSPRKSRSPRTGARSRWSCASTPGRASSGSASSSSARRACRRTSFSRSSRRTISCAGRSQNRRLWPRPSQRCTGAKATSPSVWTWALLRSKPTRPSCGSRSRRDRDSNSAPSRWRGVPRCPVPRSRPPSA